MRAALDASGIGWRVLVISACYSGGYIEALRDPRTLVVTAASKDRASFGCGSNSDITWFGKAYLAQALNQSADFVVAFDAARTSIESWEAEDDIAASKPQIERGAQIEAQLARWREQFTPGPALPFARTDSPRKSRRR
nr:C13 family peptidase [Chiayiivirga sp.]